MLVQRLAPTRLQRAQPDEHSVGVVHLGVVPLDVDVAVLELPGAFGADRRADDVGVGIVGPARLRVVGEIRRGRGAGQDEHPGDDRPPHRRYFSARTAASVFATCWLKSRSSWTMTILPSFAMT